MLCWYYLLTPVDFTKVFDTVLHNRLLIKLRSFGFGGKVLLLVISFLTNRFQRVLIGNSFFSFVLVTSGVPQGSVLGPLLFIIYTDDIDWGIISNIIKFADYLKLYQNFYDSTLGKPRREALQNDLSCVTHWCAAWFLNLNATECLCLHICFDNPMRLYIVSMIQSLVTFLLWPIWVSIFLLTSNLLSNV